MGFDLSFTSSKIFDLSEDEGKGKLQWEVMGKEVFEKTNEGLDK